MKDHSSITLDSIRDALGLRPQHGAAAGRSWFDNWMRGGPFPPAGPGAFPELDDLHRAVSLVLDGDAAHLGRAMCAVAELALWKSDLLTPADQLPIWAMESLAPWRTEVVRLNADDLATIHTMVVLLAEARRDPEVRAAILDALEARGIPTGGARR